MLLPLLSPAGILVGQQPLIQEHGIDGADVGLREQLPAHVQQPLRSIPLLQMPTARCQGQKLCAVHVQPQV